MIKGVIKFCSQRPCHKIKCRLNILRYSRPDPNNVCGGEEFAVTLPETDMSAAVQSAERLRKTVKARFRQDVRLTISVGIACFQMTAMQRMRW